ncbi:MAG: metallophosphoesterase [Candidatus Peregrinibacteria bacterium]|nr:metallophosphoesterase [Candidatus Peregrinibacteria bacterium]
MFLLDPDIFVWDLAILVLLALCGAGAIVSAVWIQHHGNSPRVSRVLVSIVGVLGFVGFLTISYGAFVEPSILRTTEFAVPFPLSQPLRIVVLSDFHVGPYAQEADVQRVVDRANAVLPDLVLLAGDFVSVPETDMDALKSLESLRASLGVFAVLGNHDIGEFRSVGGSRYATGNRAEDLTISLERMGITVLRNESRVVRTGDERFAIVGIDDLWSPSHNLPKAMEVEEGVPILLLSHNPDVIREAKSDRAALIVSGHTHGGQIRLPLIGPIAPIPTKLGRKYDQGIFPLGGSRTLAITRGVGATFARARLFAWPEVMVLTTQQSEQ